MLRISCEQCILIIFTSIPLLNPSQTPPNPSQTPPNPSHLRVLFPLFKKSSPKSNLCCPNTHECGIIPQSDANVSEGHIVKEKSVSPSPEATTWLYLHSWGWRLVSLPHFMLLIDWLECVQATTAAGSSRVQYPVVPRRCCLLQSCSSYRLSAPSSKMVPEPWSEDLQ